MDYVKTLQDICARELVVEKDKLEVRQMPSLDEDTIVLYVYASKMILQDLLVEKV